MSASDIIPLSSLLSTFLSFDICLFDIFPLLAFPIRHFSFRHFLTASTKFRHFLTASTKFRHFSFAIFPFDIFPFDVSTANRQNNVKPFNRKRHQPTITYRRSRSIMTFISVHRVYRVRLISFRQCVKRYSVESTCVRFN